MMMETQAQYRIDIDSKCFNAKYLPYLNCNAKVLIFIGGAGSGKSHFISQKLLIDALRTRDTNFIYSRKVARSIRNSQFELFKNIIKQWKLTPFFKISESTMEITSVLTGSKLIATGMDDVDKLLSIANVAKIWMEEANQFTEYDFSQSLLRLRKKNTSMQLILSLNPVECWIYNYFNLKRMAPFSKIEGTGGKYNGEVEVVHSTYRDNKFLPDSYIKTLEALKDTNPYLYYTYTEGELMPNNEGRVFQKGKDYQVTNVEMQGDYKLYGVDFGYTNPTAVVQVVISAKERMIYVKELFYKTHITNNELIDWLKKNIDMQRYVCPDVAEPARIKELRMAGFRILEPNKDIAYGLQALKSFKIFVDASSVNLLKELELYSYATNKEGRAMQEMPIDFANHAIDAMRYAFIAWFDAMKKKTQIELIKLNR